MSKGVKLFEAAAQVRKDSDENKDKKQVGNLEELVKFSGDNFSNYLKGLPTELQDKILAAIGPVESV